jgi:hypothetical protein
VRELVGGLAIFLTPEPGLPRAMRAFREATAFTVPFFAGRAIPVFPLSLCLRRLCRVLVSPEMQMCLVDCAIEHRPPRRPRVRADLFK